MNTRLLSVGVLGALILTGAGYTTPTWPAQTDRTAVLAEPALVVAVAPQDAGDGWSAWQAVGAVMQIVPADDPCGCVDPESDTVRFPASGYWRQTVVSAGQTDQGAGQASPQASVQWIRGGSLGRVIVTAKSPEVRRIRYQVPATRIRFEYLGQGLPPAAANAPTWEG